MINALTQTITQLLQPVFTDNGFSFQAGNPDLGTYTQPTWVLSLSQLQSSYQDVARNQHALIFQLTYFNPQADAATWETKLQTGLALILTTLEPADFGPGISWSASVLSAQTVSEYSPIQKIPASKIKLNFLVSNQVR